MTDDTLPVILTAKLLKKKLEDIPDNAVINVYDSHGRYSANIEVYYEDTGTRKILTIEGLVPFYALKELSKDYER